MAGVITPTVEQWEQLRDMGFFSERQIVLVHPVPAKEFNIVEDDKRLEDYDYGGEPDVWLDIVTETGNHCVLDEIEGRDSE